MLARVLRALEAPLLVAVPLVLALCAFFQFDQTALLTLVVAFAALALFFASFEASAPALRQIMPTVVLGAIAAAGRILFAPLPSFKPVSAICVVAGVVFGRRCGFMVGALAALVSNFFLGQGAWTPWQMYAWGLVGYLAGVLADHGAFGRADRGRRAHAAPARDLRLRVPFGASVRVFAEHVDARGLRAPHHARLAVLTYAAALPFDFVHGAATVVFLLAIFVPWSKKLERIKRKYAPYGARLTGPAAPQVRWPTRPAGGLAAPPARVTPPASLECRAAKGCALPQPCGRRRPARRLAAGKGADPVGPPFPNATMFAHETAVRAARRRRRAWRRQRECGGGGAWRKGRARGGRKRGGARTRWRRRRGRSRAGRRWRFPPTRSTASACP